MQPRQFHQVSEVEFEIFANRKTLSDPVAVD
jgi:hypothetical protein